MMLTPIVLLTLTALPLLGGCASDPQKGYVAGGVYRDDVRTVAVPIFENATYERGVEFELTDALVKEIESRTPWKVTAGERADTIVIGRIVEVEREVLSRSRFTRLSEEVVLRVVIDFQWQNLQTGEVLLERRNFTGSALFVPSAPSGEPIEIGQFAVVQQLARDIVDELQAPW